MQQNLVSKSVAKGGKLAPLVAPNAFHNGAGFMNPSVLVTSSGEILVNLRHVNYTLYHAESAQRFPTIWGPLAYLHPETDQNLRTVNYVCRLNEELSMTSCAMVDTTLLDKEPMWEFVGLEDARLVEWEGNIYQIGVRRDTTTNGEGRMEYSRLEFVGDEVREVERVRIPAPGPNDSYCEKNWVPLLDKPYHLLKWTAPTEVVYCHPNEGVTRQVCHKVSLTPRTDQRGSSQVFRWRNFYVTIPHEVKLFKNYLGQKDAIYRHNVCVFDLDMNLIGISPSNFSFLGGQVEFCAGAHPYEDDLLVTFGFQDNAAFILRVPGEVVDELIMEALCLTL